jgi:streptogramin lyase
VTRPRVLVLALIALAAVSPAVAGAKKGGSGKGPEVIALPNGWQPEGIASGKDGTLFVGSIPTGAVYAADPRTGKGAVRVTAREGRSAIGIKADERDRLFVAGGPRGEGYVYDGRKGTDIARYRLAPEGVTDTFVNDVVLTGDGAFFTDSRQALLYQVTRKGKVRRIPLTGDLVMAAGNNANGIAVVKGRLVIVQSNAGKLFTVDPRTGATKSVALTGGDGNVANGDGLLVSKGRLLVVQNRLNKIAVVKLGSRARSGKITGYITDPGFDVPTTLTESRDSLYAVNARFGTPPGPDVPYNVVRVG